MKKKISGKRTKRAFLLWTPCPAAPPLNSNPYGTAVCSGPPIYSCVTCRLLQQGSSLTSLAPRPSIRLFPLKRGLHPISQGREFHQQPLLLEYRRRHDRLSPQSFAALCLGHQRCSDTPSKASSELRRLTDSLPLPQLSVITMASMVLGPELAATEPLDHVVSISHFLFPIPNFFLSSIAR